MATAIAPVMPPLLPVLRESLAWDANVRLLLSLLLSLLVGVSKLIITFLNVLVLVLSLYFILLSYSHPL
jgi:hypothetical protein